MSRENDVIKDKAHYDRIYGGDNRRETEQIWERERAAARVRDERDEYERRTRETQREHSDLLRGMSPDDRKRYDEMRRREEFYRGMDSEKRVSALGRERETIDYQTQMQQRQDAKAKEKAARELAFKKAKMRYNSLNPLVKVFSKNPDKIDYGSMSADRIDSLYGGKKR